MSIGTLCAQGRTMTFTSVTDAKFFVYLNGRLQNERSTGMITLNNLEDKEYHVRIVIDDPFVVAATKRIRPGENGCEYSVRFNAVREKVELKKVDTRTRRSEESSWVGESGSSTAEPTSEPTTPHHHSIIRRNSYQDTTAEIIINTPRSLRIEQ